MSYAVHRGLCARLYCARVSAKVNMASTPYVYLAKNKKNSPYVLK
jgi:hypothetical protein